MTVRRILHITPTEKGGVGKVVERIVKNMDQEFFEPYVFNTNSEEERKSDKLVSYYVKGINTKKWGKRKKHISRNSIGSGLIEKINVNSSKKVYKIILFFLLLRQFIVRQAPKIKRYIRIYRENSIDLIHTHNDLRHGKPEIVAAWLCGIPCISHNHMYSNIEYFDRLFSKLVSMFIYVSKDIEHYNIAQGKPKSKGVIIYNGVNIDNYKKNDSLGLKIRKEYGIKSSDHIVGIIGRIVWWKGHQYFIKAMADVLKSKKNVKGLIVGELASVNIEQNRVYLNYLNSLVKSLCLEDKIIFAGHREDMPSVISSIDVLVHASSEPEPFGLVIIEGMAAEKPVIATAAGGVLDIIEDGVNGMLVPCKDSERMAESILKVISDPIMRSKIGKAGRDRVLEKFSDHQQAMNVQSLYRSILNRNSERIPSNLLGGS